MRHLVFAVAASLVPGLAQADVDSIIAAATKLCADQQTGTFAANDAVKQLDLTGDATPDTLVDEALFTCSTDESLYVAPGGSMIHILANNTESSFLVQGWDTAKWNNSLIILLALHGSSCNATGVLPCYEAITWGQDSFLSVRPKSQ